MNCIVGEALSVCLFVFFIHSLHAKFLIITLLVQKIYHLCYAAVCIFQHVFADRRFLLDQKITAPTVERIVVGEKEGEFRMLPSHKLPEVRSLSNYLTQLFSWIINQICPHLISLEPGVYGVPKDVLVSLQMPYLVIIHSVWLLLVQLLLFALQ